MFKNLKGLTFKEQFEAVGRILLRAMDISILIAIGFIWLTQGTAQGIKAVLVIGGMGVCTHLLNWLVDKL